MTATSTTNDAPAAAGAGSVSIVPSVRPADFARLGDEVAAGARILVAGSALFKHEGGLGDAVATLRARAEEALP